MSNAPHLFQRGNDPRRNATVAGSGRTPAPDKLEAAVRSVLGRDVKARLEQLDVLAASGDPAAVVASAVLLAAVIQRG